MPKSSGVPAQGCFSVDLKDIMAIGFGLSSKAWLLVPEVEPWRCFSVFTNTRSYNFICKDSHDVEAFVLSLSDLCSKQAGCSLPGSILNQTSFVNASAWCKVGFYVRRSNTNLADTLLRAVKTAQLMRDHPYLYRQGAQRLPTALPLPPAPELVEEDEEFEDEEENAEDAEDVENAEEDAQEESELDNQAQKEEDQAQQRRQRTDA